jgi:hypothetical protein
MRIAWFSPFYSTAMSKSAMFSKVILQLAPSDWEVELFVDDSQYALIQSLSSLVSLSIRENVTYFHFHQFNARMNQAGFDAIIYNFEDSSDCSYIERAASLWPGVGIFHDLNLNRLLLSRYSHSTAGSDVNEFLIDNFGEDAPKLGDWKIRNWSTQVFDKLYPLGVKSVRQFSLVLTPNENLTKIVKHRFPQIDVRTLHSPNIVKKVSTAEKKAAISCLDFVQISSNQHGPIVCYSGKPNLIDRARTNLAAIRRLIDTTKLTEQSDEFHFLWLVENEKDENDAKKLVKQAGISAKFLTVVQVSSAEQQANLIAASDIFLGFRVDELRSLSVQTLLALDNGMPVIISSSESAEILELPNSISVTPGVNEIEIISLTLKELLLNNDSRKLVSRQVQNNDNLNRDLVCKIDNLIKSNLVVFGNEIMERKKSYGLAKQKLIEDVANHKDSLRELRQVASELFQNTVNELNWRQ